MVSMENYKRFKESNKRTTSNPSGQADHSIEAHWTIYPNGIWYTTTVYNRNIAELYHKGKI